MRWTQEQLDQYRSKMCIKPEPVKTEADPGPESMLQEKIEKYLHECGYYFFHDRSRGKNHAGHPDLVIALPGGKTIWIELKSKHGRLSSEQSRTRQKLLFHGHEWHEIRSFKSFIDIITKAKG